MAKLIRYIVNTFIMYENTVKTKCHYDKILYFNFQLFQNSSALQYLNITEMNYQTVSPEEEFWK